MTQRQTTPVDFKMNRGAQRLSVTWRDGHVSEFDLLDLRKNCPCATCRTERERRAESTELLTVLKNDPGQGPPQAVGARLVGNYAIQLQWSDGHDTGIYGFRYLRSLDVDG